MLRIQVFVLVQLILVITHGRRMHVNNVPLSQSTPLQADEANIATPGSRAKGDASKQPYIESLVARLTAFLSFGASTTRSNNIQAAQSRIGVVHAQSAVDDKKEVKEYFNNEGFNRWSKIYSENGEVNSVQLDIRTGHAETVRKVLAWVAADGSAEKGENFCDVGCGVGSLSLPLAELGASVNASDISAAMVQEAKQRADSAGLSERVSFSTSDLESIDGLYDTVTCIDVMIHYPPEKMAQMVGGLAEHTKRRLIMSFAPDTWYYRGLKKIGELFPGPSKTTRAYLHTEESVREALTKAGFQVKRTEMTGTSFYFSRLLEAEKA
jgi:magnesium-protoporphyrin O-methyltransferase